MDLNDLTTGVRVVLDQLAAAGPLWYAGLPAAVAALIVVAVLLRRWSRGRTTARMVTTLATLLGLCWSAQGMWDSAVNHYGVAVQVASVLFVVFEAMMISNMLKAHEYRADLTRRGRFVRAVWVIALIMGAVVAYGEGIAQAPLRLSVPLLVAYGWWLDLTADDDPDAKPATSWRWTPRELGLRLGLLRLTDADVRDATAAERRYLADRIARLAFNLEHGEAWTSTLLRRRIRLARLKLDADADLLAGVRTRLELSRRALADPVDPPAAPEEHPVMPVQPAKPVHVPAPEPTPAAEPVAPTPEERRPQGWHRRVGNEHWMRGAELEADAVQLMTESIRRGHPLTNDHLAAAYDPPLKERNAQKFGAKARVAVVVVNGKVREEAGELTTAL